MNPWGYLDTRGAWPAAASLPEQLPGAVEVARSAASAPAFLESGPTRAVLAIGEGTGAVACEALAALTAGELSVPLVVVAGDPIPRFVGEHTLALVLTLPGEGEEVAVAAADAARRGARLVVVGGDAAGRPLAERSAAAGALRAGAMARRVVHCPLGEAGTPRAQLSAAIVSLLAVLAACDLVPDPATSVHAAADALARRRDAWMVPGAPPEDLARRLGRTIPLVYGASGVGAVAARSWKTGVNRNAKAPAFAAAVPAVTYDELAGWGQGGDVTRQTVSLVSLRHAGEPAGADAAFASVRAATDEVMANLFEVRADGVDGLGRLLDLVLCGELVSLHLAGREGVDPGPAPVVEQRHVAGAPLGRS